MVQIIKIDELPPGLNGRGGIVNLHWAKYQSIKKDWVWLIASKKPKKHKGKVKVSFTRVSTSPMDFDNIGASFKFIGDALESNGVIINDSPNVLIELRLHWLKAKTRKDQGVIIKIKDV